MLGSDRPGRLSRVASSDSGWRDEIERAIDNVKRTATDKWYRKQWHRTAALRKRGSRRSKLGRGTEPSLLKAGEGGEPR